MYRNQVKNNETMVSLNIMSQNDLKNTNTWNNQNLHTTTNLDQLKSAVGCKSTYTTKIYDILQELISNKEILIWRDIAEALKKRNLLRQTKAI